jgi:hypothetical protein
LPPSQRSEAALPVGLTVNEVAFEIEVIVDVGVD